jgi:hypothetical protein
MKLIEQARTFIQEVQPFIERYGGAKKERGIWYHGTNPKNLKSILKQGLLLNPKEKEWAEDPAANFLQTDRTAYGGVYFTKNIMTALSSVREPQVGKGMVVMSLQPRTFFLDEDDLTFHLREAPISGLVWTENGGARLYIQLKHGKGMDSWVKKSWIPYKSKFMNWMQAKLPEKPSPKLVKRVSQLLPAIWEAVLMRAAAYVGKSDEYYWKREFTNTIHDADWDKIPKAPNPQAAEKAFRDALEPLTRTLKMLSRPFIKADQFNPSARAMETINYKGSNKIIAVLEIQYKDAAIGREKTEVKVHYPRGGKVPAQFEDDFKDAWGDYVVVKEFTGK